MRLCNKQSGFTLIELIVIIAIVAVFAGIAVPNFLSYMPKSRLNGAARQVMGDLMAARMKAVSLNQNVKVSFGSDSHIYQIWNDANGDGTVADDEGDDIERDIHPDYHDVTLTKSADPIFQSRGTVSPTTTITLSNTSDSNLIKYVKVAITGRVKIDDTP